jgi:hypothetical protein
MVTFETKCWDGDWALLLKTSYLEEQIARNGYAFAVRSLLVNNVSDPDEVSHHARRAVVRGVLTEFVVVDQYAAEALEFFGLSRGALGRGYVYSAAELVGIYRCRTPYLLHFAGDCVPGERRPWLGDALAALAEDRRAAVANPTWNGRFAEAAAEALAESGPFFAAYGFSDQCYLVRTNDFRAPIYGEHNPLSERYPAHGGESFEKRVDAWMRNHGRHRLTHKFASYRHLGPAGQVELAERLVRADADA